MSDSEQAPPEVSPESVSRRPQHWPWVLGAAILAVLAIWLLTRPREEPAIEGPLPPAVPVVDPLPIRPADGLTRADEFPVDPGALAGCNLLLITLDTVRADRVRCYGNTDIQTPALDGLAERGILFSNAIAAAPTTAPSHASILTGMYPVHHGVRANGLYRLDDQYPTLTEVLSDAGYKTAAFVSAFVLDAAFGLSQGFGVYDDDVSREMAPGHHIPERRGDRTTDLALDWLKKNAQDRFFVWVHLFDPHHPYEPPGEYAGQYAGLPYDGEIAFADAQVDRLVEALAEMGVEQNTLVVVAGDHGEGLGQHGETKHGYLLYDSTLQVPLLLACGERIGGGVYLDDPTSLVDVAPTVLKLLDLPVPGEMDGVWPGDGGGGPRPLVAETLHGRMSHGWASLFAAFDSPYKYIHGPDPELYDLSEDPFERENLIGQRHDIAEQLEQKLAGVFGDELSEGAAPQPTEQLSAEELAKLESLGYVMTGGGEAGTAQGPLPDPKEMLALKARVDAISESASDQESTAEAVRQLHQVAEAHPDFEPVYIALGKLYQSMGLLDQMEAAYKRANQVRPDMPHTLITLARIRVTRQDLATAESLYRRLLDLYPDHYEGLMQLGTLLLAMGRANDAVEPLGDAFERAPGDPRIRSAYMQALLQSNQADQAAKVLERQVERRPNDPVLRNELAQMLATSGSFEAAIQTLQAGLKIAPGQPQLINNLAAMLANCPDERLRDPAAAARMLEQLLEAGEPVPPDCYLTLSVAYGRSNRIEDGMRAARQAIDAAQAANRPQLAKSARAYLAELQQQAAPSSAPATRPSQVP